LQLKNSPGQFCLGPSKLLYFSAFDLVICDLLTVHFLGTVWYLVGATPQQCLKTVQLTAICS